MKRILITMLLMVGVSIAGDTPVPIDYSGWYAGIGYGVSQTNLTGSRMELDDDTDAVRLFGGRRVSKNFAIEAGIADLGEVSEPCNTRSGPYDAKARNRYRCPNSIAFNSVDASLLGILPLVDGRVDLFARAGLGRTELYDGMGTVTVVDYLLGAGVQVNLLAARTLGLRLDYTSYNDSKLMLDSRDLTMVSVLYRF